MTSKLDQKLKEKKNRMKAIKTTYKGATDTKKARIIACDEDGNRVTISYPYKFPSKAVHRKVAVALCEKIGFGNSDPVLSGSFKNGYVFIFTK